MQSISCPFPFFIYNCCMSVVKLIKNFKKTKRTLFTTPSHSQGAIIADQSADLLGKKVFACDYSEIEGFDNLANPIGAIS